MDGSLAGEVVRGLLPTVGVSLLFGAAIWAIVRADASERAERARLEAEEDAAAARAESPHRTVADAERDGRVDVARASADGGADEVVEDPRRGTPEA
ncbi:hypothetical protein [Aquipuribacter sp. SD81]|uniref:hypothetical protein n=1 Tax=Aquipuribacter sp. SD81 TaxID=3127703 RepID=UPI00301B4EC0